VEGIPCFCQRQNMKLSIIIACIHDLISSGCHLIIL